MKNILIKRLENNLRDETAFRHFCFVCGMVEPYCALTCKNTDEVIQTHLISKNYE